MRATAMSLACIWNLHTRSQHKQICPLCDLMNDVNHFTCPLVLAEESSDLGSCSLSPVKHKTYSASFYLCANGSLVSWFLMTAGSSSFWSKNANLFSVFRLDATTKDIPHDSSQKILKNQKAAVCAWSLRMNHAQTIGSPLSFSGNSCLSENPPSPLSNKSGSSPEVSDLFNLLSEDSEWISDLKSSSPFSSKSDSSTEASDYLDSLLSLEEEEDGEWILGPKTESIPSPCCELVSSAEDLLQTHYMEQVTTDEPLFWPFQEEFNWDSEQSWTSFCISPRKHINLLGTPAESSASKLVEGKLKPGKGGTRFGKQNGDEAECRSKSETPRRSTLCTTSSAKRVPMIKPLSASKNSSREDLVLDTVVPSERRYFTLDPELPIETLLGLREFDGHEGLDSEFNGNVLILD